MNKIKIQIAGVELEISSKFVNGTKVYMNQTATANAVKQYVKKSFPGVVVSVSSSTFAGGNSVDIYVSDKYGRPVSPEIERQIESFGDLFVYGRFNSMEDLYEFTGGEFTIDGWVIDAGVKYLHVNNRPRYSSAEYTVRMLTDMTQTENYVFGQISLDEAINQCRRFGVDQKKIDAALKLYNELTEAAA